MGRRATIALTKEEVVVPGRHRDGSSVGQPRWGRVLASVGAGAALLLVVGAITAACMGDDNKNDSGKLDVVVTAGTGSGDDTKGTPVPILATFTATPPDFTPEVIQTRSALQTAAAETAEARTTATPPPAVTPNQAAPTGTIPAGALSPPTASLLTSAGSAPGSIGSYNWADMRLNAGANVTAPYVILPESGAQWATSTEARLEVTDSDLPVTGAEIKLYVFDQNVAIPTDQQGNAGDTPAFYPQTNPTRQFTIQGQDILFTPEVPPGRYVVDMRVNWSTPTGMGLEPLWTQYIFLVDVV